jgi:protein gp37
MSDNTHIEWTDATWNIITGCSVVSAGCKHCYAMKLAETRLRHHPSRAGLTVETKAGPVWNGEVRFNPQWLTQPMDWTRARRIFVCAHGDLFHEGVQDAWLDQIFAVMAVSPQHSFQVLTKRPERMLQYMQRLGERNQAQGYLHEALKWAMGYDNPRRPAVNLQAWPLPNVWLGVSVEDQAAANERIPFLLKTPAAVRWISAEPLLGPVDLTTIEFRNAFGNMEMWDALDLHLFGDEDEVVDADGCSAVIDWVVAGGESGRGARPMHPDWARSLRDQCAKAGVAFLFKQWGSWLPICQMGETDHLYHPRKDPDATRRCRVSHRVLHLDGSTHGLSEPNAYLQGRVPMGVFEVGKKASGRLLDGRVHDEYPGGVA